MKILALEFSSPQRSVAVLNLEGSPAIAGSLPKEDAALTKHYPPKLSQVIESGGQGTNSLRLIDEALREAKLEREQIECLAIGLGPGSYTGIRAAIAIAQGWQLARGVNLLGISSAECLAAQAQADNIFGRVNVVIDAQRNEFYLAGYDISASERRETTPLRLVGLSEVQRIERAGEILIGPEVTRWFASGKILFPRAARLAEMAVNRSDIIPGEKLLPIYLRETSFVKAPTPRFLEGNASSLP